jgi:hypothetical protein
VTIAAGVVSIFLGLGFGIPGIIGLRHFAQHGEVWTFMGFPTYGGGPFERMGLHTSVPLLGALVAVCVAELVVGALLLGGQRSGIWLALGLLPFELVFWIGFALPFGPILGLVRTGLVIWALLAA